MCSRGPGQPQPAVKLAVPGATGPAETKGREMRRITTLFHRGLDAEDGAATAEYAIATMAAVGFAGLLVVIMRSDEVRAILTDLVHRALTFAG